MGKSKRHKRKGKVMTYSWSDSRVPCHTGSTLIFEKDNVRIYAGGRSHSPQYSEMDLIIDLTGGLKFISWPIPKGWGSAKFLSTPNVLALEITDSQAPWHVEFDFWLAFWADLVNQAKTSCKEVNSRYSVLEVCQGGHGRTGVVVC